jgi:catechol 2,3-dioxygenase-like lactoylglutathione lyase family enzyme
MLNGWISLRVKEPKRVAAWYTDHKMLELVGGREDIGTQALGSREHGLALILIHGDQLDRPDLLQLHLHVADVDAEYERLKAEGVKFEEPPKTCPGAGAMPTPATPPAILSRYVLRFPKLLSKNCQSSLSRV